MSTKRVVIDAGHGGNDPGAIGNGLKEKDLNLQAAKYMYKRLTELGIPATLIRGEDETLDRKERIRRILNAYGTDKDIILISNHINAGGGEGAEIVYALRNNPTLATMALENIGAAGQKMRKVYQRRLPENPNKDYYFIIRDTPNLESLLVEYGFIDNTRDSYKLKNNLNDYVEGVVKAIADYSGVPYNMNSSDTYIVKPGDTLYSIGKNNNISVDELIKLNNLSNNIINVNQELKLKNDNYPPTDELVYTVVSGDSLWKISRLYNVPVNEIVALNNLDSINLQVGDKLKIPTKKYTVKAGDTLWSIAKNNNISVDKLKEINNLTDNTLSIGKNLIIPN